MHSEIESIKICFEEEGMSPSQIASDRKLDVAAVKSALMQSSSKYRAMAKSEPENEDLLNFNDNDMILANQVIRDTARFSDSEDLRFKAAVYIRNDKKGRLEVARESGKGFNIFVFNEQMAKLRERRSQSSIDVPSSVSQAA